MRPTIHPVCLVLFVAISGGLSWLPVRAETVKDDALILPGKSIGQVKLDAEIPAVEKLLGKPTTGEGAGGRVWDIWDRRENGAKQSYRVTVYGEHTANNDSVQSVQSIRINSPFFHTREGINTRSSLEAIWKTFPLLRYYSNYQHEGETIEVYADGTRGISFEIRRTTVNTGNSAWGACQAVSVYHTGAGSVGPLVPTH